MKTKYNENISNKLTVEYLKWLIGKVIGLLYTYEDSLNSREKYNEFLIGQNTLIRKINGHVNLLNYNNIKVIDLLSHLESLSSIENYNDYRRHILKIKKILEQLIEEVGDVTNGL